MAEKEQVKQIFQIVLVVRNVEEALGNWKKDVEFDRNSISCGTTDVIKYAEFDFGGINLRLAEPLDKNGEDPYAVTLRTRGQGFHHIGIYSADSEKLISHLEEVKTSDAYEEIIDEVDSRMYDFEKEIGLRVAAYSEMIGPCAR